MFRKVLVANRGEIAVRLVRALREMDIPSVAVYSEADRASLHVRLADQAVHIGPPPSSESYLNIARILDAARSVGAEAIHPGYGFLSENAEFARACGDAGFVFIGPAAESIRSMGWKTEARRMVRAAGVPVIPGTDEPLAELGQAERVAETIGYPVMLKAAAGGGGKGMRRVESRRELEAAFRDASSEAERAFSSGAVYLEKALDRPRHIEVQILADRLGNTLHLGERECSIQRRHQKLIEECPSPLVASCPEMRDRMGEAAVRAARAAGYVNAGTVEFLVDADRNFYFLEMNTRLQVEHPVTELVTGLDLVHQQIRIAAGEPLAFRQDEVRWRGAAIECRICAEDPDNHFLPSPGKILRLQEPSGPGIRLDSGIFAGCCVPMEYDPLLAKLVAWADSRSQAIQRIRGALNEYYIAGIRTNLGLFRQLLDDEEFQAGNLHTAFIDNFFKRRASSYAGSQRDREAIAALVAAIDARNGQAARAPDTAGSASPWLQLGRRRALR